ncbi:MAG TPA: choice-of-anchor B family protein [Candidatus Eisenbacteria bacterium]|nr:choice-of-anchor B family protein [Candidatus Eisenbacteria bacterium]
MTPGIKSPPGAAHLRILTCAAALAALLAPVPGRALTLRNFELKAHFDNYPPANPSPGNWNYSSCWSYIHHDGREYAVIGTGTGTAFYNVTDPAAAYQVGFIPGPASKWREMKQYRSWMYVVTEGFGAGEGIQIIRMTDPEHPVLASTYATGFARSHTVSVDTTRAILVCNGTRYNAGLGAYPSSGMRILSLASPEAPAPLATWPSTPIGPSNDDSVYVHDSVPIGNRLYASSIYYGIHRIFDFTNPGAPVQIAAWHYPGGFTHNSWPDKTGNWLYITDEKNGEPLKIFDISNLSAPVLFNRYTSNPAAIVHNVHVKDDEIYVSNYTEGIRVLDASDPGHPAEFGFADSYAGPSGNYDGVWAVCPYFPSGTVIASDMQTGLWVYRPRRDYGLLRVKVVDSSNGQPIAGATLYRGAAQESLTTTAFGVAVFALDPGSHTITAKRFGYANAQITRNAVIAVRETVTVTLAPLARADFTGMVQGGQGPLEEAGISLDDTNLHTHTDASGHFELSDVPVGPYGVNVTAPGYIPLRFVRTIGPGPTDLSFTLPPVALWNPIESSAGWTVGAPGDDANDNISGQWQWVDPLGTQVADQGPVSMTSPPVTGAFTRPGVPLAHEGHREAEGLYPGPVQPENDRTPNGTRCFVTGQGTLSTDIEGHDLDGLTTLTSPALDATGMAMPTIGFWFWFFTNTNDAGDYLDVLMSGNNGGSWTLAKRITGMHAHWQEGAVRIADHVAPTAQVKVRFVASEKSAYSVVEAAIDDLTLYDATQQALGAAPFPGELPARLGLRSPWPNPASGRVSFVLEMSNAGHAVVDVLDLQGRHVARVFEGRAEAGTRVLTWEGRSSEGRDASPGIYFVRAVSGGESRSSRVVKIR